MRPPFLNRRRRRVSPLDALAWAGMAAGSLGLYLMVRRALRG